ncbi:hypothetical protein TVAG_015000 [Trichomonas vaginalis G3]|uniref:Uncharacterized protein n=1 Tax=Trichomonas vaginalis (strain ATCC PRA-98 / G3) TaxID=412133 RepID=A2FG69_TRIV3|nr:phospholipase C/P1 nuclease family [Trichomonas vaginalis G3]EAX96108.1 hypothetical protein TVAG_015000 [Trichomonas vaginalis G3]KAI5500080.1 phospholipase C/P1 nuclease family [Trichomonas vaginalis G3]|eukprot:XP_001309038.1 hypothetical protein [Trichomonas vaginalis G3]
MTTVSNMVMDKIELEYKQKLARTFLRSADYDLAKNLSKLSTWMNYVERPPFNLKCFNHWHFSREPFTLESRNYIPQYNGKDNLVDVLKESATKIFFLIPSSPFILSTHLKVLFAGVPDIHATMHTQEFFSNDFPDGDRNGQVFYVMYNGTNTSLFDVLESGCGLDSQKHATFSRDFWEDVRKLKVELFKSWETPTFSSTDSVVEAAKIENREYTKATIYSKLRPGDTISDEFITECQTRTKQQILKSAEILYHITENKMKEWEIFDIPDGQELTDVTAEDSYGDTTEGSSTSSTSSTLDDIVSSETIDKDLTLFTLYITYFFMILPLTVLLIWRKHYSK